VITTGGLGPTEDDLTREAVAAVHGEETAIDPELEVWLRGLYQRRGAVMPERNIKQTWLIPSARAIPNPRGTAPGWWVERDGKIVICMPGPPSEMNRMWEEEVAPELLKRHDGTVLIKRTLKTAGIGESNVDEILSPLLKSENPATGLYARADGVHVRMGAKAPTQEEARALIAPMESEMRRLLHPYVWGADDDTFEKVLGEILAERRLTLAVMESCTGGLLADTITNVPGSSRYFRGGIVAYATEVKAAMGVDTAIIDKFGVYSDETAKEMARAIRERLGADIGIGTTGVAGPDPDGATPVGEVHIAIDGGGNVPDQVLNFTFNQSRTAIKRRAVTQSLMLLRRALTG
jgi:nicotinamide-nucleotide amidase